MPLFSLESDSDEGTRNFWAFFDAQKEVHIFTFT